MKTFLSLCSIAILIMFSIQLHSQSSGDEALEVTNRISVDEFYKHMGFFAHDSMIGRDIASAGINYSQEYIIKRLQELNIEPAGENNTYYQTVPLRKVELNKENTSIGYSYRKVDLHLQYGEDIILLPSLAKEVTEINSTLAFAGNGIVAPDRNVNAYENLDVKGKIVIINPATPQSYRVDSSLMANSRLDNRIIAAGKEGAVGVIYYFPMKVLEDKVFRSLQEEVLEHLTILNAENKQKQFFEFDLDMIAMMKTETLEKILTVNGKSLKKIKKEMKAGSFKSFELEGQFNLNCKPEFKERNCRNVAGLIRGSDPELRDEYIVLSAHLDHVGIGKPVKKDSIYNGAWDNASGSSGILCLAEALSELPVPPKRSVIFLWCTAEEKGLLGSNYFVSNPTVDIKKIKACVNLDMVGGLFESKDYIAMGYDASNISEAVDFAGKCTGLVRDPDLTYENRYFQLSDHFSFVREGIPGIFVWGGFTPVGSDKKMEKIYLKWEKKYLHKPQDDMNQDFSDAAFLNGLKLNFLTTWYLANELDEITWNPDSHYYKKFVLKEGEAAEKE